MVTLRICKGGKLVAEESYASEAAAWERRDVLVDADFQVAMLGLVPAGYCMAPEMEPGEEVVIAG